MPLVPILLVVHVTLAVALLLPSVLLPFALRVGRRVGPEGDARPAAPVRLSGPARFLVELHARGSTPLAGGLALTGLGLLAALGPELLSRPWLLVALAIYALNVVLALFVQRPNLRRLLAAGAGPGPAVDPGWRDRTRRQRYVSYAMAGLVGTIGFLMSTKPEIW